MCGEQERILPSTIDLRRKPVDVTRTVVVSASSPNAVVVWSAFKTLTACS